VSVKLATVCDCLLFGGIRLSNKSRSHCAVYAVGKKKELVLCCSLTVTCKFYEVMPCSLVKKFTEVSEEHNLSVFTVKGSSVSCLLCLFFDPVGEGTRDSSVDIANGYGLDDQEVGVRVPVSSRIFSSPRRPDRLWGPSSLLSNGYREHFPRR
jgi:hypothetical protein